MKVRTYFHLSFALLLQFGLTFNTRNPVSRDNDIVFILFVVFDDICLVSIFVFILIIFLLYSLSSLCFIIFAKLHIFILY